MANINIWGTTGNQAFALPMVMQTPTDPVALGYVLAWDTVNQALNYFPMAFAASGDVSLAGNFNLAINKVFKVNAIQVVGPRATGWTPMTGASDKVTVYDPATVTLAQIAGRVSALQAALAAHGLTGV